MTTNDTVAIVTTITTASVIGDIPPSAKRLLLKMVPFPMKTGTKRTPLGTASPVATPWVRAPAARNPLGTGTGRAQPVGYGAGPAEDVIAEISNSIQAVSLQLNQLQDTTGSQRQVPTPERRGTLVREVKPNSGKGQRDSPRDNGKNNLLRDGGTSPYPPSQDDRAEATAPANYDSAIQLSKPKDADDIKLTSHPKVGEAFTQWQDNTRERIRRASAHPQVAFTWILRAEDPD